MSGENASKILCVQIMETETSFENAIACLIADGDELRAKHAVHWHFANLVAPVRVGLQLELGAPLALALEGRVPVEPMDEWGHTRERK